MNDEDRISQAREDARRKYAESQEPPKKKEPRDWQAIIDEQAAQIDINTLPGKGKPLNLNRNPYADEADELANSLLKNAGFTLPWIEDSRKIDAELAAARAKLVRARDEYHEMRDAQICAGHQWVEGSWQAALREFRQAVENINRQIRDFNLKAPNVNVHKFVIRVDEELARLGVSDA
ncbi:MAG: DUF1992 domain-containing protein [Anaerolineales bacterium]|nr:DUF1992 domain-containing protein [Anaerolineae bacterium]MCB9132816.1 DUF1992 domain-containing protein [Anaerolineales bacterium]